MHISLLHMPWPGLAVEGLYHVCPTNSRVRLSCLEYYTYSTLIDKLERVQRVFTRRIPGLEQLTYGERLRTLDLESLEYRRLKADLLLCFKIVRGFIDLSSSDFFVINDSSITRGHRLKIAQQHCRINARSHFFSSRITSAWNSLPDYAVNAESVILFKHCLSTCKLQNFYKQHA